MPCDAMRYHAIPCDPMRSHAIPKAVTAFILTHSMILDLTYGFQWFSSAASNPSTCNLSSFLLLNYLALNDFFYSTGLI